MERSKEGNWIEAGYQTIAEEGIEGIKIERLARKLNLNKSGFYHYFGSMETYLKKLLKYHVGLATHVAEEIAGCKNLDPDLLRIIMKHKVFILVESQLLVKYTQSPLINTEVVEAVKIVDKELLSLLRKGTGLSEVSTEAKAYLDIIRHFFYSRINSENIKYTSLHSLSLEAKEVLSPIMQMTSSSKNFEG